MNAKKWIRVWAVVLILIPIVGGVNYVMDPYGTNNKIQKEWNSIKIGTIKRPLSYKLPIIKEGNIDTLLLGTSRVGVMDTKIVNKYYSGNLFNLSSPTSLVDEQYHIFKYSLKFNKVKTLIYAIDFMSFNGAKENGSSDFQEHKNSIKEYKDIDNPLIDYISIDTLKYSVKMILKKKDTYYSISGQRNYLDTASAINNNTLNYDVNKIKTYTQYSPYKFSYSQLNYFKKIKELCKEKNIKLIVYTPPMYFKHFLNIYKNHKDDYLLFKAELSNIIDYVDFSGVNEISKDHRNYYDESHLKKELAEHIFFTINSTKKENFITKKLLKNHLLNIDKEYEDNKKSLSE